MLAETPEIVRDASTWLGAFSAVVAAGVVLNRGFVGRIRRVIEEVVHPLHHNLEAKIEAQALNLRTHLIVEEQTSARIEEQMTRGAAAMEHLTARAERHDARLDEIADTLSDHIANPKAHSG